MSDISQDRPYVGIGVVILRDDKVLLGERVSSHGSGTFLIPGGHLEFGESIPECAAREVEEETGLTQIKIANIICANNDIVYDKHFISIGVLAYSKDGEPSDTEPDKSKNWQWYGPNKLPNPIFIPSKRVIDAWLNKQFCNEL